MSDNGSEMTYLDLWRVTNAEAPNFGTETFWWFSRRAALTFLSGWVESPSYPFPEPAGTRALFHASVTVPAEHVADLRPSGALAEFSSVDLLKRTDQYRSSGYLWIIFYEGAFVGKIQPQALYLGDDPVPTSPANFND